jgi:hypothetical protein
MVGGLFVTQAEVDTSCSANRATSMTIVFEEGKVTYSLFRKYRVLPKPNFKHFVNLTLE